MTEYIRSKWKQAAASTRLLLMLSGVVFLVASLIAWAVGGDGDGMDDEYEIFFGLNTASNDAAWDYDSDNLINSNESLLWTDPWVKDTDFDGFNDDVDSNALSRMVMDWGDDFFTTSNDLVYTWPSWGLAAWQADGQWDTNAQSWHVSASESNDVGLLSIDVDRTVLTNDVRLELCLLDHAATLYIDLADTNGTIVATNLYGNLLAGTSNEVVLIKSIPLETYTNAASIVIYRGTGEVTIYSSILYIDEDGDGLDSDQEVQLGTFDNDTDSDDDGMSDDWEVAHGFDPAVDEGMGVSSSGLQLWVKADTLTNSNNDPLDTWTDSSGQGNDLTQATGSAKPTFKTGELNSQPVVRFDGSDDWLGATLSSVTGPVSVVIVSRFAHTNQPVDDNDYLLRIGDGTEALEHISISRQQAGAEADKYYSWMGAGEGAAGGPVLRGARWQILTATHATNNPYHALYVDGVSKTVSQYSGAITLNGALEIGRYSSGSSSSHCLDGDIAEVLIYNRVITSEERGDVEAYLQDKYAIDEAPVVDAGDDQDIIESETANLAASISGTASSSLWSKVIGPGNVTFGDATSTNTTAQFNTPGGYRLKLTAWTSGGGMGQDELDIIVSIDGSTNVVTDGLSLWVQADGVVGENGDKLAGWIDRSGKTNDLAQTTSATYKPTLITNALNGRPVVRFDGTADYMEGELGNMASPITIITVTRFDQENQAADDVDYIVSLGDNTEAYGHTSISRNSGGDADADKYYSWLGVGADAVFGPVLTGDRWQIISAVHSTNVYHSLLIDGMSQTVDQYAQALDIDGSVQLGKYIGTSAHYLDGDIAEVLIYDRELTGEEREAVEVYLGNKYGIDMAPAVDAGADQDVIEVDTINLAGSVTGIGAISSLWSKVVGPGTVTFGDAASTNTTAQFSQAGGYRLKLTGWSGNGMGQDELDIVVSVAASTNVVTDGLRLWVQADGIVGGDGDLLASWVDRSGKTNDLAQTTSATYKPTLITNALNGRPVVRFDGTADYMEGELGNMASPITIITVTRFDQENQAASDVDYVVSLGDNTEAYGHTSISRNSGGDADADKYYSWLGVGAGAVFGPVLTGDRWQIISAVHSTNVYHSLLVDGTSKTVDQYAQALDIDGSVQIGKYIGTSAHYLDGDIAEILIYDRELTGEEREAVELYLSNKYDIDMAPEVDAGPDQGILESDTANLTGLVTGAGAVSSLWSKVIGPGAVIFGDAASTNSTAQFSQAGGYRLRLTGWSGNGMGQDELDIVVSVAGSTNVVTDGLRLWVQADAIVGSDGDLLASWLDRSGNTNDLSQTISSSYKPMLITNALNGRPVVRFDGTSDYMEGEMGTMSSGCTVVVVSRFAQGNQPASDTDYVLHIGYGGTAYGHMSISRVAGGLADSDKYYSWMGSGVAAQYGETLVGDRWHVLSAVHAANAPRHRFYTSGESNTVDQYNQTVDLNGDIELGRYSKDGSGNHYLDGDITEVLVYDRVLSDSERQNIEYYLVEKYLVDSDEDLMPDTWEYGYFNSLGPTAAGDFDGDGVGNRSEYLRGMDPTVGYTADTNGLVNLQVYTPLEQ